jgi:hypothetical protein
MNILIRNEGHQHLRAIRCAKQNILDDRWAGIGIHPNLQFELRKDVSK